MAYIFNPTMLLADSVWFIRWTLQSKVYNINFIYKVLYGTSGMIKYA